MYISVLWDESSEILYEEQGPLGGVNDQTSDIPTHILFQRRIEKGPHPRKIDLSLNGKARG